MMLSKAFLKLLVIFLGFSYVLSSAAVPTTRSLMSNTELDSSIQDLLAQDEVNMWVGEELFEEGEGFIEERMMLQSTDYPGTGSNNHHDPKPPARA